MALRTATFSSIRIDCHRYNKEKLEEIIHWPLDKERVEMLGQLDPLGLDRFKGVMLEASEIAEVLGICLDTAYREIKLHMSFIKIGRCYKVSKANLLDYYFKKVEEAETWRNKKLEAITPYEAEWRKQMTG
jgi:hypothetical protein